MLEYSLELEQKIAEGGLTTDNTLFTLAFCGDGFYWHQDQLEDFVSFYYSGVHRADDPFSQVEQRHIYVVRKLFSLRVVLIPARLTTTINDSSGV